MHDSIDINIQGKRVFIFIAQEKCSFQVVNIEEMFTKCRKSNSLQNELFCTVYDEAHKHFQKLDSFDKNLNSQNANLIPQNANLIP